MGDEFFVSVPDEGEKSVLDEILEEIGKDSIEGVDLSDRRVISEFLESHVSSVENGFELRIVVDSETV